MAARTRAAAYPAHRGDDPHAAVLAKSASARDIENFKTEAEQWVDKIGPHPNIVACHYLHVFAHLMLTTPAT